MRVLPLANFLHVRSASPRTANLTRYCTVYGNQCTMYILASLQLFCPSVHLAALLLAYAGCGGRV